jgi:hypothetical protein
MARHVYDPTKNYFSIKKNVVEVAGTYKKVKNRISAFAGKTIIGYKKARPFDNPCWACLVKLEIPAKASRLQPKNKKCRASRAKVLEIRLLETSLCISKAKSGWDPSFIYRVGEIVKPKKRFSTDWKEDCASGIHFFLTEEEALNYSF